MEPVRFNLKLQWLLAALLMLFVSADLSAGANADVNPEQVRAIYLLQLRKFAQVGNPHRPARQICYYEKPGVSASDSVGQILKSYLEKHPTDGLSVQGYHAVGDFSGCDIFYVPAAEEANLESILTKIGSAPILTVGSVKRYIYRGGMIGFVTDDANHVRMEGNLDNMKSSNVVVDAQVLDLMQQVIGK